MAFHLILGLNFPEVSVGVPLTVESYEMPRGMSREEN